MNKVFLIGRLTADPELRYVNTGANNTAVVSFNLAVNKNLSKEKRQEMEAQNKQTADFPRITVWGKQAESISKYLKKGSQCAVDGRLETGSYVNKETGVTVYTTDVVGERVEFLGSSNNQGQQSSQNSTQQGYQQPNYQQPSNQQGFQQPNYQQPGNQQPMNNNDNHFDDDFTEIEDDGRIPF